MQITAADIIAKNRIRQRKLQFYAVFQVFQGSGSGWQYTIQANQELVFAMQAIACGSWLPVNE